MTHTHNPNDCGCRHAICCLECPLPECLWNSDGKGASLSTVGAISLRTADRVAEVRRLRAMAVPFHDIAGAIGVSRRTIYRLSKLP